MLKCTHSNEICGVVPIFVVSKSDKVNLRLRNGLNFACYPRIEHNHSQSDLLINETMETMAQVFKTLSR